jgi:hypothetical protein
MIVVVGNTQRPLILIYATKKEKVMILITKHSTSDYLESIADIKCYLEAVLDSVNRDKAETLTKGELEIELRCLKTALENMLVAVERLGESDEARRKNMGI